MTYAGRGSVGAALPGQVTNSASDLAFAIRVMASTSWLFADFHAAIDSNTPSSLAIAAERLSSKKSPTMAARSGEDILPIDIPFDQLVGGSILSE